MSEHENQFQKCIRLGQEARAKLGIDYTALFRTNPLTGSRLSGPGMQVDEHNRISRIKTSDPDVHKNARPIERPLNIMSIESQELDEIEVEQSTEDDTRVELLPATPAVEAAGEDTSEEPTPLEIGQQGKVLLTTGVTFHAEITQVESDYLTVDGGEEYGVLEISPEEWQGDEDTAV